MRKLYEKPELTFEQFSSENIMDTSVKGVFADGKITIEGEEIIIDGTTGNQLNSIDYRQFTQ